MAVTELSKASGEAQAEPRPKLDVVICHDGPIWELDWYTNALGDYDVTFHRSPDYSLIIPGALYMLHGSLGFSKVPKDFLAKVKALGNCGVIHLGDEFFRGPYSIYGNFAYAIRTHFGEFLQSPAVLQIPLGYSNNMQPTRGLPASQRKYAWAFTGAKGPARVKIGKQWESFAVGRNFLFLVDLRENLPHLSRQQFLDLLTDAAFVPCPMGNAHLESLRIYEALERGAIPIVSTRKRLAYFDKVLGKGHPIPQFVDWASARAWAEDIYSRPADLDRLQAEILDWWAAKKLEVRRTVGAFVAEGLRGAYRARLERDFAHRSSLLTQPARLWELYRHHDASAMHGRVQITSRKIAKNLGLIRGPAK